MNILDKKISYFEGTKKTEVMKDTPTIMEVLDSFYYGTYKNAIEELRNNGNENIKSNLPTFAVHGIFKHFRTKDNFIESSGLIILDIDDVEESEIGEIKQDIMDDFDSVVAVMTSPSGNGIKVLYYVHPDLVTVDSYRQIGKELVSMFAVYGEVDYLSITDCLIATYDPNMLINEDAVPDNIMVKDVERLKGELEEIDSTKVLWTDAKDFFETVLYENIAEKTNNNFHFIQVSVLDLKKYGFIHPNEDLSFVIDYAENTFKSSSSNKSRFLESVEVAKNYPQLKWAYKLYLEEDIEDDELIDYSDFQTEVTTNEIPTDFDDVDNDEEYNGLIDIGDLWDQCITTMSEGNRVGYEIALKNFADALRFRGTGILTTTGIPGHGKTEFIDAILIDLARLYDQQSLIAGFEQTPAEHIVKLMRKMIGADITDPTFRDHPSNQPIIKDNFDFITEHFKHIDLHKIGGNINDILKYSAMVIKQQRDQGKDPKYIVLDPFNMLSIKGKFSNQEKIEEILRRLSQFSHQMGILVFLVAHPFKMKKDEKTGQFEVPDFYSVKGSSAFFEMSYHGIVVYRGDTGVMVKILKVKQNNLGERGAEVFFDYERDSGRYIPIDENGNELEGDHRERNWLIKYKEKFNK